MNIRKNPDIEDARQYDGSNFLYFCEWSNWLVTGDQIPREQSFDYCLSVKSTKGILKANAGDWVIKYKNGDMGVCKQEDLHKTIYQEEEETFQQELKLLITKHSKDTESSTPTWILANYLVGCLDNFNEAIKAREKALK